MSSDPEADALFKSARSRQRTDPEGARASYQEIVRRWPGSHEAKLATEYLAEMDR
ncbi:MAG: tetratricopeptide repeat protein [Planctomycetota bacterium]|nr:tetratricopeptide repeat protein [Planctomycetota bacterium]